MKLKTVSFIALFLYFKQVNAQADSLKDLWFKYILDSSIYAKGKMNIYQNSTTVKDKFLYYEWWGKFNYYIGRADVYQEMFEQEDKKKKK